MGNSPDDVRANGPAAWTIAQAYIGRRLRVHRPDGWYSDRYALIRMVLPSREHICWLIEYPDGATDVVRVFDNPDAFDISYELIPETQESDR